MRERPINLKEWEVRAILEGRKTQTRRLIKPQPTETGIGPSWKGDVWDSPDDWKLWRAKCPYGQPGDRLWVREAWTDNRGNSSPMYRADLPLFIPAIKTEHGDDVHMNPEDYRWTPSIHMPRWASRITLEIVSVRVERLQDISEDDAKAEAVVPLFGGEKYHSTNWFAKQWKSANGLGSWCANPWVWVVEFKKV